MRQVFAVGSLNDHLLTVDHLPVQHCMRPGFDLTVAERQGLFFVGLYDGLSPERLCSDLNFDILSQRDRAALFIVWHCPYFLIRTEEFKVKPQYTH